MSYLFKNIHVDKYNEIKSFKTSFLKFLLLVDIICLYFFFKAIIKYTQDNKTYSATIYKTKNDKFTSLNNIYKLKLILTITGILLLLFNIFIYLLFMSIYKNRTLFTQYSITFYPLIFLYRNKIFTLLCLLVLLTVYSIYIIIKNKKNNRNNKDTETFQNKDDPNKNIKESNIDKVRKSNYPYFILYKEFTGITFAIIFLSILIVCAISYFIYKAYLKCLSNSSYSLDTNFTQKESYINHFTFVLKCFFNSFLNKLLNILNKLFEYIIIFSKALLYLIILLLPYLGIILFFYITIKWFNSADRSGEKTFGRPV